MMKQMQFIDAYIGEYMCWLVVHNAPIVYKHAWPTCKLGLRHKWACAVPLLRHKSRLKSDFFHNFECTEYFC